MPQVFHKLLISFCPLDWIQSEMVGKIFPANYKSPNSDCWCRDNHHQHSQEGIAPLPQAARTVPGLLGVGATRVFQPLPEEFFIFLQNQELPKYHICLVKTFVCQLLSKNIPNSSQSPHRLLAHRLSHEVPMLLGGGRHTGWC